MGRPRRLWIRFDSLREAAEALGIRASTLYRYINQGRPYKGHVFELEDPLPQDIPKHDIKPHVPGSSLLGPGHSRGYK